MAARAIGSGTVSFGLVSIPVKVYSTTESSSQLSFNMLHSECGTRLKQQYICPKCEVEVGRNATSRGYEFAKGQYVVLSDEEHKTLQEVASNRIELAEFVPAAAVDPIFFEKAYFLGPDKGGERAYRLLAEAMQETERYGVARYSARGKQYLVLVRPQNGRLVMHQMHYPDEVKSFDDVPIADAPESKPAELKLATQFIEQLSQETFAPTQYEDEVKARMLELIEQKIAGQEITTQEEAAPQAKVIDLMEALKASLGEAKSGGGAGARKPAKAKTPTAKKSSGSTGSSKKKSAK